MLMCGNGDDVAACLVGCGGMVSVAFCWPQVVEGGVCEMVIYIF